MIRLLQFGGACGSRRGWGRKQMRRTSVICRLQIERLAERAHQAARERLRGAHRDLLAQQRADRQFKGIPCTGNAQTRMERERAGEQRIARQVLGHRVRLDRATEHPLHAGDERGKARGIDQLARTTSALLPAAGEISISNGLCVPGKRTLRE